MLRNVWCMDTETTNDVNDARIWSWAFREIEDRNTWRSGIDGDSLLNALYGLEGIMYIHNLKHDADSLLYVLRAHGFKPVKSKRELNMKRYSVLISGMGQWYSMTICWNRYGNKAKTLELRDSAKILPFKLSQIAKDFKLKTLKGEIDYNKYRPVGYEPDKDEWDYQFNDVDILCDALLPIVKGGFTQLTQGSFTLQNFKDNIGEARFKKLFPKISIELDKYLRDFFSGGITMATELGKELTKQGKQIEGVYVDATQMYPAQMRDKLMPCGQPEYFKGEAKPTEDMPLYVQKFTCNFEIKEGHMPFIATKRFSKNGSNEFLKTTKTDEKDINGNEIWEEMELNLTGEEIKLLYEQYHVYNFCPIDGYYFRACQGVFTDYIDKNNEMKREGKRIGNIVMIFTGKVQNNAMYGKFGARRIVTGKQIVYEDDGFIRIVEGQEEETDGVYLPVALFTTSYARCHLVRNLQKGYEYLLYCDTDSGLFCCSLEKLRELGLDLGEEKLGQFKLEDKFDDAKFLHAKCYAYHSLTMQEKLAITKGWKITVAGMPVDCFEKTELDETGYKRYINVFDPAEFKPGLIIKGTLKSKRAIGGRCLLETEFQIKES